MNKHIIGDRPDQESLTILLPLSRWTKQATLQSVESINASSPGAHVTLVMADKHGTSEKALRKLQKKYISTTFNCLRIERSILPWKCTSLYWEALRYIVLGKQLPAVAMKPGTLLNEDIVSIRRAMRTFDLMVPATGGGILYIGADEFARTWLVSARPGKLERLLRKGKAADLGGLASTLRIGAFPTPLTTSHSRISRTARKDAGHASPQKVCIIAPRTDLPFKKNVTVGGPMQMIKRQSEDARVHWHLFPRLLEAAFQAKGAIAERITLPNWEITPKLVKSLPHDLIFVPHRDTSDIPDPRCVFYMQEVLPNFFTVDRDGWAARSSRRGSNEWKEYSPTPKDISRLKRIRDSRLTKFGQIGVAKTPEKFVFVPLQLPHDEVIKRDADHSYEKIVASILDWAVQTGTVIVLKQHPFGKDISYIASHHRQHPNIHIVNQGHVHEYIEKSDVVFLANSGVGFEALIYNKPVVNFARAMYDSVTFACGVEHGDIDRCYHEALAEHASERRQRYNRFMSWYFSSCGAFMDDSLSLLNIGRATLPVSADFDWKALNDLMFAQDDLAYALNEELMGFGSMKVDPRWPSLHWRDSGSAN